MIVYLEGPDGSGKSTLAKQIESEFENVVPNGESLISTHPTRPNRVNEYELYNRMSDMINSQKLYILDRGPISDCIYRIFDKYKPITTLSSLLYFVINNLDKMLIVYCKNEDAEENMLKRGDDNPVAISRHKELSKLYDLVMNIFSNTSQFIEYNFSKDNITKILDTITKMSKNLEKGE